MGLPLPFLASLPESVWTSLYNLPLLNTLTVCSSIGGLLGLLLVQRNRGGRVLASLALLAEVMLLAGAYLYPIFLTVSRNLLPNYLAWAFFTATSLLTAAGVIGCGLLMSRPRWLTPFSCLLLLLGLSLGIAWTPTILLLLRAGGLAISTVSSILFPTSLSLVATLMWAALGYALFIWRDAPLIRSQPMTN